MSNAAHTGVSVPDDQLAKTVDRIRLVADDYRVFDQSRQNAVRYLRIPGTLLDRLIEAGLPHRRVAGDELFDPLDLKNAMVRLGVPSPQLALRHRLAAALTAGSQTTEMRQTVDIRLRCPAPGHPNSCDFRFDPGAWRTLMEAGMQRLGEGHFRAEVALAAGPARFHTFSGAEQELISGVSRLESHLLPEILALDIGFVQESGLSDCRAATTLFVAGGTALGMAVRPATGLFLTKPFPMSHAWVELLVQDEWLPADPFLLSNLARWLAIDGDEWPVDRMPLGVMWKWAPYVAPKITHRGSEVDPSVSSR